MKQQSSIKNGATFATWPQRLSSKPFRGGWGLRMLASFNWSFWLLLVLLIVAWQLIATHFDLSLVTAPPTEVVSQFGALWRTGVLGPDLRASGIELGLGFLIGSAFGIVLGIFSGALKLVDRTISPLIGGLYSIPILALAPLFIVSLGLGLTSKVVVVALATFFPMFLNTSAGVADFDESYRELGRSLRLSPVANVRKLIIPSALPYILSGFRIASGHALTAVLAGELFGARFGVGLMIINATESFNTPTLYVGLVIFAVAGVLLNRIFAQLEKALTPWKGES